MAHILAGTGSSMEKEPQDLAFIGRGFVFVIFSLVPAAAALVLLSYFNLSNTEVQLIVDATLLVIIAFGILQFIIAFYGYWDTFNFWSFIGYIFILSWIPILPALILLKYTGRGMWKFNQKYRTASIAIVSFLFGGMAIYTMLLLLYVVG